MLRRFSLILLFALVSFTNPLCSMASTRRALIMGNDSYPGNALRNAKNDAQAVAEALAAVGYNTTLGLDLTNVQMVHLVDTFADTLAAGDAAVVYYAGHGLQLNGENYLVPTDFHVNDSADVKFQGYALGTLLEKLTLHGAATQIVILDACRDNPFLATRSTGGGWAGVSTSAGTFLAFGTSPGSTASDDPNDNHGLFTKSLLKFITASPLDVEQMFQRVRQDVIQSSYGHQIPWTASSLIGSFHIVPSEDISAPTLQAIAEQPLNSFPAPGRSLNGEAAISSATVSDGVMLHNASDQLRSLHFSQAIQILQQILATDPTCGAALRLLGVALHLTGRSTEAMQVITRELTQRPDDALAYSYRCLFVASQDPSLMNDDCNRALSLNPKLREAHMGVAIALDAMGDATKAYDETSATIALDPKYAAAYILRGDVATHLGHRGLAQQDYMKATQLSTGRD